MLSHAENIDALIERIALCQSRGDAFFPIGIFPSYRHNKYLFYRRPDTNIFYTATIVFILNQVKGKVSAKSQTIIEHITARAIKNYPDFQNKDGLKTYNFWKTKPSKHFPNGSIFKHFDHFRIPDDIDDTALVYLTLPYSTEDTLWLKEKVKQHTHPPAPKGELNESQMGVYSTWFGKNMPIEHDVCALCNLMYLFEKHQLPHNEYDETVFAFLGEVILEEKYITDAFEVAHNYATTPLIIYHYARLLGDFEIPQLEVCREKLINKIKQLLDNELDTMNRVILETSLMKLDKNQRLTRTQNRTADRSEFRTARRTGQNSFTYFIAGLLSSYKNPILYFFAPFKITQMEWECEAHELALIVERTSEFAVKINNANSEVRSTD
ncbi:hypothetical protein GCM10011514_29630 [Emticicia aquatilis]|uniref:Uncharacterized protein n=1 Tax=Emticicia aquatilis TaxID=1537369 RepID=A0A917DST0_9BACT|nr:hypothetical protein [Emticicia aquatilis]GGD63684.1 hypothetical protein GCM10011514_29630 [Emticicia aquatilis]